MRLTTLYESDGFKYFGREQPKYTYKTKWIFGGPPQERPKHPPRWYYGQAKKATPYKPSGGPFVGQAERYEEHILKPSVSK